MERPFLPEDRLTESAKHLVEEAVVLAGNRPPDARHLLLALIHTATPLIRSVLPNTNLDALEQTVEEELQNPNSKLAIPYEGIIDLAMRIAEREEQAQTDIIHILKAIAVLVGWIPREAIFSEPPLMYQMGLNVTEQARHGSIPRVVGREQEIDLLIEVLCRPINPYAVLVGMEGVGRRAVVQGVAQRIADGRAPQPLHNRPLVMLPQLFDHPQIMGKLIEEAVAQNAILYMEPFETFLSAPAPQIEALRMEFLSALIARRVPIIGAVSNLQGLRRHINRAPDQLKRFQPIEIRPLNADETLVVLQQLASLFKEQQQLEFPNETLRTIVEVSGEHIQHRPFPDKAILLMDHIAGRARAHNLQQVEPRMVWETAGVVTGLPIGKGEVSMLESLRELQSFLKTRVMGQDEAIETLVRVFGLKIRRLDIRPERPNGVFLFAGPTGVGKTETARALAEFFFGSRATERVRAAPSEDNPRRHSGTVGGDAMNDTLPYPDEPPRDLPADLQQAVRKALAATHHLNPPPRYDTLYWHQEREALANGAVWQAAQAYRAETEVSREAFALLCAKRAIFAEWERLCKRDKIVVPMPVEAETGEEVEFEDAEALEAIEGHLLCVQVREALARLSAEERQLVEWYFGEGLSEREIAKRVGRSKTWVHKQLGAIVGQLRGFLLGGSNEERGREVDLE